MKSISHSQFYTWKIRVKSYKNDKKKLHDQLIGLGMVIKCAHKVLGKRHKGINFLVLHCMEHEPWAVFLKSTKEILRQAFWHLFEHYYKLSLKPFNMAGEGYFRLKIILAYGFMCFCFLWLDFRDIMHSKTTSQLWKWSRILNVQMQLAWNDRCSNWGGASLTNCSDYENHFCLYVCFLINIFYSAERIHSHKTC